MPSDDLEQRVAEALDAECGCVEHYTAVDVPLKLAECEKHRTERIAAALRATATRGVFAGRETMVLRDKKDEWSTVKRATQDAEAAGLAALEGGTDE